MPALNVNQPYPVFADSDGSPLDNGYIWIGTTNLDPRTSPITVYSDRLLTIPVAQPLRTLNGYFVLGGTPSEIFVNATNYSILVQDQYGRQILAKMAALSEDKVLSSLSVTGSLGVSGASTLASVTASSLQVNGNTTVTGSLTAASGQISGNQVVNGNLGVGVASPAYKVDVQSTTSSSVMRLSSTSLSPVLDISGSTAGTQSIIRFITNNVEQARLATESNVGQGVFTVSTGSSSTVRFRIIGGQIQTCFDGTSTLAGASFIRAWARFSAVGASGNLSFTGAGISSIVKAANNALTINFASPMPDANYAILQGPSVYNSYSQLQVDETPVISTTSFRILCVDSLSAFKAPNFVSFAVVR